MLKLLGNANWTGVNWGVPVSVPPSQSRRGQRRGTRLSLSPPLRIIVLFFNRGGVIVSHRRWFM